MWMRNTSNSSARKFALALCISVVLGGSLPDLGNLIVYYWFPEGSDTHIFNLYFLVVGLLGLLICGIALLRRRNMGNTLDLRLRQFRERRRS